MRRVLMLVLKWKPVPWSSIILVCSAKLRGLSVSSQQEPRTSFLLLPTFSLSSSPFISISLYGTHLRFQPMSEVSAGLVSGMAVA